MLFTRLRAAALVSVVAVLGPAVAHALPSADGSYNINVDAAGNVSVSKATGIWHPAPAPSPPSYKVTDPKSAALLKALGPASVNLSGTVSGNVLNLRYVNGTAMTGNSTQHKVPLFDSPTAHFASKKINDGDQVQIVGSQKVGGQTWLEIRTKSHVKGWLKIENVSYRIYFALTHGPATPTSGVTGAIPH